MDENVFFREATLRICGNLEIEEALGEINYLTPYRPGRSWCDRIVNSKFSVHSNLKSWFTAFPVVQFTTL
jgi:hypothetical protein